MNLENVFGNCPLTTFNALLGRIMVTSPCLVLSVGTKFLLNRTIPQLHRKHSRLGRIG